MSASFDTACIERNLAPPAIAAVTIISLPALLATDNPHNAAERVQQNAIIWR